MLRYIDKAYFMMSAFLCVIFLFVAFSLLLSDDMIGFRNTLIAAAVFAGWTVHARKLVREHEEKFEQFCADLARKPYEEAIKEAAAVSVPLATELAFRTREVRFPAWRAFERSSIQFIVASDESGRTVVERLKVR